ncbi:MAG: translocation/assembly module TamB domain-containing protein [Chitinophagales bacterium]
MTIRKTIIVLLVTIATILLLFVLAIIGLQQPKVQNYLVEQATHFLSKKYDTQISLSNIDINIFSHIVLNDVFVQDWDCDTLLYAKTLEIDIAKLALLKKELLINDIIINNLHINLIRHQNEEWYNYQYPFVLPSSIKKNISIEKNKPISETDTLKNGFKILLDVEQIKLKNTNFRLKNGRSDLFVKLTKLDIDVSCLDIYHNELEISQVLIEQPDVSLRIAPKVLSSDTSQYYDYNLPVGITPPEWLFFVNDATLRDGRFRLTSGNDTLLYENAINFNQMDVTDINIHLQNVDIADDIVQGYVKKLQAKEQAGFIIESLTADVLFSPKKLILSNAKLITPNSYITDYVGLHYKSLRNFYDFVNRVKLDTDFKNTHFTFADIGHFARALHKVKYIHQRQDEKITLSGQISDKISKIKGENLIVKIGNSIAKGDIRMRGLPDFFNSNIDFKVDYLNTNIQEIRYILPDISIPQNFDKLGNLAFKGRFTGFPNDFVAEGYLKTDVGQVKSDLKMLIQANELPIYSGELNVENFDIGKWFDKSKQLGKITFNSKINGKGLHQNDLDVNAKGIVNDITFNNYTFRDIDIDGHFAKKLFRGGITIDDPNIQLDFQGLVDMNNAIPAYEFDAKVRKIHLQALHLLDKEKVKDDIILAGTTQLKLKGNDIDNIVGQADFQQVVFTKGDQNVRIKNIEISSSLTNDLREASIVSDLINANFEGKFEFKYIVNAINNYLYAYFPYQFKYKTYTNPQQLSFELDFKKEILPLIQVFVPKVLNIDSGAFAQGELNTLSKKMKLTANIPKLLYDKTNINHFKLEADSNAEQINFYTLADTIETANFVLPTAYLQGNIKDNSIDFDLNIAQDTAANHLFVNGLLFSKSDTLKLIFKETEILIKNKKWEANTGIFTYKDKNFFEIEDMILSQGEQLITLRSQPNETYNNLSELLLVNINLSDFDYIPAIRNMKLEAILNGNLSVIDIFGMQQIEADVLAKDFVFNGQKIGDLKAQAIKKKTENLVALSGAVKNKNYELDINGNLLLPKGSTPTFDSLKLDIKHGKLAFIESFVGSFISNTSGNLEGRIYFDGVVNQPNINGFVKVLDGKTTVDYLGTTYDIENQIINFNKKRIDINNQKITDKNKNEAFLNGFLNLNDYKNLSINLNINTSNFLFMDTKFEDNELFYGTAYGDGQVTFRGPLSKIEIGVKAKSNKGTNIYLPISYEEEVSSEDGFYRFINKTEAKKEKQIDLTPNISSSGYKMNFDFDITPDAEIQIIFDRQAGDIMKGRGAGNIKMEISTINNYIFDIFGDYVIDKGSYLFTLQNVVNKYFTVEKGSTVSFKGDPYQALLNVKAIYEVNTNRKNLLSDIEQVAFETEADIKKRVPFNVYLNMTGSLLNPNIKFNIKQANNNNSRVDFLVTQKLRDMVANNQNELNKQIFGLLVFNQFMPAEEFELDLQSGVNTTVSELLSNYLNSFLNDAITNVIPDSELNVNWRNYNTTESNNIDNYNRNEIEVNFTKRLFNDRMSVNIGGNVDVGNQYAAAEDRVALAYDFIIEYNITPDGKYKLKAFNKYDYDIFSGDFTKTGASISVSQEFDSFKDLLQNKERKRKRKQKAKEKRKEIEEQMKAIEAENK